ncbi:hypothetical protein LZL79_33175, partial [Pseudomonas aeruginosa]|nr:hypothetical protein [Pseudomonas aeruginosa]
LAPRKSRFFLLIPLTHRGHDKPNKHIDDATWRKVEKETVKAVIHLQASVKDTEVLRWLILKGLEEMTPEDLERFHKKRD